MAHEDSSLRSYIKIQTMTSNTTSTVTLTDTTGALIECDFVKVFLNNSITGADYLFVVPSGVGSNPAVALGNNASGSIGVFGTGTAPAIIMLSSPDKTSAITITWTSSGGTTKNLIVMYGKARPVNQLRDNSKFRGA